MTTQEKLKLANDLLKAHFPDVQIYQEDSPNLEWYQAMDSEYDVILSSVRDTASLQSWMEFTIKVIIRLQTEKVKEEARQKIRDLINF